MAVASVIVEIEDGAGETVLNSLAVIHNISIYGLKDNQIIVVIEGDNIVAVEETMKMLSAVERIIGVYPVYAGDYE